MAAKTPKSTPSAATATPAEATPAPAMVPGLQLSKGATLDFEAEIAALEAEDDAEALKAESKDDSASLSQDKETSSQELDEDGFPKEEEDKKEIVAEETEAEKVEEEVSEEELGASSEFFEKMLGKAGVDKKFINRTRKVYEQNGSLKQEIEAAKAAEIEAKASAITPLPSGPLASIDSLESLDQWQAWALEKVALTEDDIEGNYKDNAEATAEEQLENDKKQARFFLKHYKEQANVLKSRTASRLEVAKAHPELFDSKSEEGKLFRKFNEVDPRLLPDWDKWIARAIRMDKQEKEEASGAAKYTRIDLKKARSPEDTAKGKQVFKPVVVKSAPKAPVKPQTPGRQDVSALEAKYLATRSEEDYKAYLAAEMSA